MAVIKTLEIVVFFFLKKTEAYVSNCGEGDSIVNIISKSYFK